jgi:hypothetical protein
MPVVVDDGLTVGERNSKLGIRHMHMRHANGCMYRDAKWMLQMYVPTFNRVMYFTICNM